MKLRQICQQIANDLLCEAGTKLELMDDMPFTRSGRDFPASLGAVFESLGTNNGSGLIDVCRRDQFGVVTDSIKGVLATRFRKYET